MLHDLFAHKEPLLHWSLQAWFRASGLGFRGRVDVKLWGSAGLLGIPWVWGVMLSGRRSPTFRHWNCTCYSSDAIISS